MPKLIAILAAMLVGAVVALGLCQALSGREGMASMAKNVQPSEMELLSPVASRADYVKASAH